MAGMANKKLMTPKPADAPKALSSLKPPFTNTADE